jgi:hypothetical protein
MTAWVLNIIGLLATTVGALFVFLHLHRTASAVAKLHQASPLPEGCLVLLKDRQILKITVGLIAAWFVIQYAAAVLT